MFSVKHKYSEYFANIVNIILHIMFKLQILKSYLKKFIIINYYYNIKKNKIQKYFRDLKIFKNII